MGFCTFMKTVEITRHKQLDASGGSGPTTLQIAREIFQREGIRGINKGVNAVAVRQCTNWGSRIGLSRIAEGTTLCHHCWFGMQLTRTEIMSRDDPQSTG